MSHIDFHEKGDQDTRSALIANPTDSNPDRIQPDSFQFDRIRSYLFECVLLRDVYEEFNCYTTIEEAFDSPEAVDLFAKIGKVLNV